jgi:hypothetical protein
VRVYVGAAEGQLGDYEAFGYVGKVERCEQEGVDGRFGPEGGPEVYNVRVYNGVGWGMRGGCGCC